MKGIVVIGLGSMGRRRIRLLKQYDKNLEICGVDSNAQRTKTVQQQYAIHTCDSLEQAVSLYQLEAAMICTSPLSHAALIAKCLEYGLHVFSEINLVEDGYLENITLAKKHEKVLFLSSTPMYRSEIEYIKKEASLHNGELCYRYHVGQYLPDWHPWESYKDFFVSDKRTNGCREILAVELPWLVDAFGHVKEIHAWNKQLSHLELEFPDTWNLVVEHENGIQGMVTVDVVCRKAVHNFELYGEKVYLTWDGTPLGLSQYDYEKKEEVKISLYDAVDNQDGYSTQIIENAYYSEIVNFFQVVLEQGKAKYSFEKDCAILSLIKEIESGKK